ncbi:MAG: DUF4878 domain-containing protein [Flavobacteriales bacterium]|nr:DUF4878 domain-containing protein [Flavobacteriales bacterium]
MKLRTLLVGAVAGLLLTACGGGSSPEDVTRSFAQALADGDCTKAMEMAVDAAKESVQGSVDAGCEKYDTDIKSVTCETSEETATCTCEESRTGMDMTFNYDLKKVDGEWKISNYQKDLGMDMDLGEEE